MPFTEGRFRVQVKSALITKSTAKGTPGIELYFGHDEYGTISHTLWVTPNTRERVYDTLEFLGVSRQKQEDPGFLAEIDELLSGAECEIVTKMEQNPGYAERLVVKYVNPLPQSAGDDVITEMYGLLTGRSMNSAPRTPPVAPHSVPVGPAASLTQQPITDDDVPF